MSGWKVVVCNFTAFSDHAPLHIQFKAKSEKDQNVRKGPESEEETAFYKWDSVFKDLCYNALVVNSDRLRCY